MSDVTETKTTNAKEEIQKEIKNTLQRKIKLIELFGSLKPINPKRIAPSLNYVAQAFEKR